MEKKTFTQPLPCLARKGAKVCTSFGRRDTGGKHRLLGALLPALLLAGSGTAAAQATDGDKAEEQKPLLTIACLSDIHNELSLISGNVEDVRLRGTFVNTIGRIHDEEDIDLICLGGDYTSDVTINEANWKRVKELMSEAAKKGFKDSRTSRPVIYVTGNHDYEVANFDNIPKGFNAGDYQDVMEEELGAIAQKDAFYEDADNGTLGTQRLLAAYHYKVKGFDFVMLNCGLRFFKDAWDYTYSEESVQWVRDKLEEIYSSDPDKTVFFLLHIPFSDSNSISAANKGMKDCAATTLLKATLAQYPNLVMLYGHDHGTDSAYIRSKTSQRVTRYNTDGEVIATTDETHVDEQLPDSGSGEGGESGDTEQTELAAYIQNASDGLYLSLDDYNLATVADEAVSTFYKDGDNLYVKLAKQTSSGQQHLHIGSGGRFSCGDATATVLYEVKDASVTEGTISCEQASFPRAGHTYIVTGVKSGTTYALSNTLYKAGSATDQRLEGVAVTIDGTTATLTASPSVMWKIAAVEKEEEETELTVNVKNEGNGLYLNLDDYNLATVADEAASTFYKDGDNLYVKLPKQTSSGQQHLHIGSGGRFSCGDATATVLYEVKDASVTEGTISCEQASFPKAGHTYIVTGVKSGTTYALSNTLYKAGSATDQRLEGVAVTVDGTTATLTASKDVMWTLSKTDGGSTEPEEFTTLDACVRNAATGKYIGTDSNNLNTIKRGRTCNFYKQDNELYVQLPNNERHLHIGSGGRFSRGDATALRLYEVADTTATGPITCTEAAYPQMGHTYIFTGVKSDVTYALTNTLYNEGGGDDQRLDGKAVTVKDNAVTLDADKNLMWTLTEEEEVTGEGSFFSTFMGSMRYYNNSIEGDVSVTNSKIVQALMVYVYPDSITLKMKNYGESGTFGSITINKELAGYTVYRKVTSSGEDPDAGIGSVAAADSEAAREAIRRKTSLYDMAGRRVSSPRQRGVYIVDGRKVVL